MFRLQRYVAQPHALPYSVSRPLPSQRLLTLRLVTGGRQRGVSRCPCTLHDSSSVQTVMAIAPLARAHAICNVWTSIVVGCWGIHTAIHISGFRTSHSAVSASLAPPATRRLRHTQPHRPKWQLDSHVWSVCNCVWSSPRRHMLPFCSGGSAKFGRYVGWWCGEREAGAARGGRRGSEE